MVQRQFSLITDDDRLNQILDSLRNNRTLAASAQAAGTSRDYLTQVLNIGAELAQDYDSRNYDNKIKDRYIWFYEEVNKARAGLMNACMDTFLSIMNDPNASDNVRLDAAKWILSRIDPDLSNKPNKLELEVSQKGLLEDSVKSKEQMLAEMEETVRELEVSARSREVDEDEEE